MTTDHGGGPGVLEMRGWIGVSASAVVADAASVVADAAAVVAEPDAS